jgi:hypothetical protein
MLNILASRHMFRSVRAISSLERQQWKLTLITKVQTVRSPNRLLRQSKIWGRLIFPLVQRLLFLICTQRLIERSIISTITNMRITHSKKLKLRNLQRMWYTELTQLFTPVKAKMWWLSIVSKGSKQCSNKLRRRDWRLECIISIWVSTKNHISPRLQLRVRVICQPQIKAVIGIHLSLLRKFHRLKIMKIRRTTSKYLTPRVTMITFRSLRWLS